MNKNQATFQIGGSLADNSPSYVERKADSELEKALKAGEFCYVLNSRQMGKSSLRVRVMSRLQAVGIVCIFVDLTGMGTQDLTPEKWYAGIARSLVSSCQIDFNWRDWWRERRDLFTPVQRLGLFIEEILLVGVKSKIVIFIDEIDRVLSQYFSLDDFFALIHSCYQKRQLNSDYQRLTFTLLGVAAPRDLIRDKNQSPFDIGRAINLEGFTLEETTPLIRELSYQFTNPQEIIADILSWTRGQPFLTQKLCHLVLETIDLAERLTITKIVEQYIINDWEIQDEPEHLRTIRDRIVPSQRQGGLYHNTSEVTIRLLSLYRDILQGTRIRVNNSPEQIKLRLSGLVVESQGILVVNNPIYARIFDFAWIESQLKQLRPYDSKLQKWLATNCSDTNYLLKGKELQNTLTWALGKSLADLDYQFLVASQDLVKQEIQHTLDAVSTASQLLANARKKARQKVSKKGLSKKWLNLITLVTTGFILLLRSTGILQTWEWNSLDRFFRWQLTNKLDSQIVVVTIDEQDIRNIGQLPIPDRVFSTAIKNLKQHQPNAIALDIYRDLPVSPGNQELLKLINDTPNLYVVEKIIGDSVAPPPNVNLEQVGFADQILDSDGKVRRALLSLATEDRQTHFSLATKLALHYLNSKQIQLEPLANNRYRLGTAIFERFTANDGGYVQADAGGYQILLNYWGTADNFQQYSLTEVLNNQIKPEQIKAKLILIGSTAESIRDAFYTPYSKGWFRSPAKMPGVFIQANVTNQIIGAAMDNYPLLHTYNKFLESLWILLWGMIGMIIGWQLKNLIAIAITIVISNMILITICYQAFIIGCWLPFMPALLTSTLTLIVVKIISSKQRDRLLFQYTLKSLTVQAKNNPLVGRIALEYFKRSENQDNSLQIEKEINRV